MPPQDHYLKAKKETAERNLKIKKHNTLVPLPVLPNAPVRQDERQLFLKKLYQVYYKLGIKYPVHESVTKEYELAKKFKDRISYSSGLRNLIFNLNKYGNESGPVKKTDSQDKSTEESINWHEKLLPRCIRKSELIRNGFIMDIPTPTPLNKSTTIPTDKDYIKCDRCGESFKLEEQMIPKPKACLYHKGKVALSNKLNGVIVKFNNQDYKTRYHSCCNTEVGHSNGCTYCDHHVYKLTDPYEMHCKFPFQKIQDLRYDYVNTRNKQFVCKPFQVIGLDCEMCFTSQGFELMKCSIIDIYHMEKAALDIIIKPKGEIIDLNSHVSGVDSIPDDAIDFESFMDLLANMTDENTIIVGHGLENDLNVLRLIYPNIIDTAILYSESSIRKDPLKKLAANILHKDIQSGSHDSLEDATIPLEIVKFKNKL